MSSLPSSLLVLLAASVLGQGQVTPSPAYSPPSADSGVAAAELSAQTQWANLLGNSLWFFDAQRSGQLGSSNRVSWRNDSALEDGQDVGVDLTGGFYDAGDYIKFTYPLVHVLASIAWGGIDHGAGYDGSSQTAYLDSTLRWGLDWMIKAHPSANTLYVQVGQASVDNNYWGGDQNIPLPRNSYQVNSSAPGTDVAASSAAAFAAAAVLYSGASLNTSSSSYSPASLTNQTYAATLLQHAQDLYTFATTATPYVVYSTSVPAAAGSYTSSSYTDELVWGALWLALATNSSSYYSDAVKFYNQYNLNPTDTVFNWDSVTPALPVLFVQIALARPSVASNVTGWQTIAEKAFDGIIAGSGRAKQTKGGLLWYNGDSDAASLNPALNAAMLLLRYAPLASTSARTDSYSSYAQDQIDYFLGNNPMSAPYVVGQNPNSPKNPHSAMAAGGSNINAIDTSPVESAHVLYGAVIGGPAYDDKFYDIRSDYDETEVALDYNAPLLTLAAMCYLRLPDTPPYYTRLAAGAYKVPSGHPCDNAYPCSSGLSTGAKIAIGVIVPVAVIAIAIAIYVLGRKKLWWGY